MNDSVRFVLPEITVGNATETASILVESPSGKAYKGQNYLLSETGVYTVKYLYAPAPKALTDESDFPGYPIGERMLAYGIASEYCLIAGDVEAAESWESRYRAEIERFRPYEKAKGTIPSRYWI